LQAKVIPEKNPVHVTSAVVVKTALPINEMQLKVVKIFLK
jgi:hypothetical protein